MLFFGQTLDKVNCHKNWVFWNKGAEKVLTGAVSFDFLQTCFSKNVGPAISVGQLQFCPSFVQTLEA